MAPDSCLNRGIILFSATLLTIIIAMYLFLFLLLSSGLCSQLTAYTTFPRLICVYTYQIMYAKIDDETAITS